MSEHDPSEPLPPGRRTVLRWIAALPGVAAIGLHQAGCSSEGGSRKLSLPGAQAHDEQLTGSDSFAGSSQDWLEQFLDGVFLAG